MKVELLVPYGEDKLTGRMVKVGDVPNGKSCGCVCPACGEDLIAKQGDIKAHHFAHVSDVGACESWLHATAKKLLFQRMRDALEKKQRVPFAWRCARCRCSHQGNLLEGVSNVNLETHLPLERCTPDIHTTGPQGPKLIEIIVTHEPDYEAKAPLFMFRLETGDDLEGVILADTLTPQTDCWEKCLCKFCPYCQKRLLCPSSGLGEHHPCMKCQICRDEPCSHCVDCGVRVTQVNKQGQPYLRCYECAKKKYGLTGERETPRLPLFRYEGKK